MALRRIVIASSASLRQRHRRGRPDPRGKSPSCKLSIPAGSNLTVVAPHRHHQRPPVHDVPFTLILSVVLFRSCAPIRSVPCARTLISGLALPLFADHEASREYFANCKLDNL